jgi:hypothetical protein
MENLTYLNLSGRRSHISGGSAFPIHRYPNLRPLILPNNTIPATISRAMRPTPAKSAARIIDFVDTGIPVLYVNYINRSWTLKNLKG